MKNNKSNLLTRQARHKIKRQLARIRLRYNFRNRAADEKDFQRICKGEDIQLLRRIPLPTTTGIHIFYKRVAFIYLNPALNGDEFLWVAFHEIGHHFLHIGRGNRLDRFNRIRVNPKEAQFEAEADYFAELVLMRKVEVKFNAEK